jgi:flavin reductase (DIM6/NTAB) family NADH-FMN oxidoreductase RutF
MMRTVAAGSMIRTGELELGRSMQSLAAGVLLVAVCGPRGAPLCAAAASFNSVSLDPPIVVWSANAACMGHMGIRENSACGLSVLADDQGHLAAPADGSAAGAIWDYGEVLGAPMLAHGAAVFEVIVTRCMAQGDRMLYFAEVARFDYRADRVGLLRFGGHAGAAVEPA